MITLKNYCNVFVTNVLSLNFFYWSLESRQSLINNWNIIINSFISYFLLFLIYLIMFLFNLLSIPWSFPDTATLEIEYKIAAYYIITFITRLSLVPRGVFGTLSSSFGRRWSNKERNIWTLNNVPHYLIEIIVGLILSDSCIEYNSGINAYLRFEQSIGHFYYLWFVFELLSPICISVT